MTFEYSPIIIPLLFSSIALSILFIVTLRYRSEKAARIFLGLLTSLLIWSNGFVLEILGVELSTKIFWANIQFLGILFIPFFLLWLTIVITGQGTRLNLFLKFIAALAFLSILIIWTDDLHHFFRGVPYIDTDTASFPILVNDYSFWFYYIQAPIAYISYLHNFILLIRAVRLSEKIYRMQAILLIFTMILPLTTDLLYVLGISPIPNFNLTLVIFSISGIFIGWALFRYKMLDVSPLAYQLVIQNMKDGVVVLDQYERIVSLNTAAYTIIGTNENDALGQMIDKIIPFWSTLKQDEINIYTHPSKSSDTIEKHYEILVSPIFSKTKKRIGRVITLRNVTQQIELQQKTEILASTDSLTNVLNRRAFFDFMDDALDSAKNAQSPLSFIMIDIDNFKNINDEFGHHYGDETLVKVALKCQDNLRKGEIVGRYGGDEFCILLPQTTVEETKKISDRVFKAISSIRISSKEENITLNISMGIANYSGKGEISVEEILSTADKALYQAKDAGKNQSISLKMGES